MPRYKKLPSIVKKRLAREALQEQWKKKQDPVFSLSEARHREAHASAPVITTGVSQRRVYRNGVELPYKVKKYYVIDPAHQAFAKEITYNFHGPLRSSFKGVHTR